MNIDLDDIADKTVGGIPLPMLLLDALRGLPVPAGPFAEWAVTMKLARQRPASPDLVESENNYEWVPASLEMLEPDALVALYSRIKKLQ